jgi:alkaline phosphatase
MSSKSHKDTNSYWTLEWIVKNGKDFDKCKCKFFGLFFAKHIILEMPNSQSILINKSSIQEMTESFLWEVLLKNNNRYFLH